MPRLHSSVILGVGVLILAGLLEVHVIPNWVITPQNVNIAVLSPDFWPYIVAGLLAVGGILLLLQYILVTRRAAPADMDPPERAASMRVALVAVLMVCYYLILPHLGMVWSSVIAYLAFAAITGTSRKKTALAVSVILPVLLYAFFNHAAGVPIPQSEFLVLP